MKITALAPYVPQEVMEHAGGTFLFHYLNTLAQHNQITLLAPFNNENSSAAAKGPAGVKVHLVPTKPRSKSHLGRALASFPNLPGGLSPGGNILRGFRADREAWSLVAESDLVEIQWNYFLPFVAEVAAAAPSLPITVVVHDVITELMLQQARSAAAPFDRVSAKLSLSRVRRQESRLLNHCATVFVFKSADRQLLKRMGVESDIQILDPYLHDPGKPSGPAGRAEVLFTGAMGRPQNWEGALWLIGKVWPLVHRVLPEAKLSIVGSNPPARLLQRSSDDVSISGWMPDLDYAYRRASVFVAPNLSGAGLKFKVPQAMLYALPVVATPIAAEGVLEEAGLGVFGAVTDVPSVMADAIVNLLSEVQTAREVGLKAREWALGRYSFERSMEKVVDLYDQLQRRSVRPAPS